MKKTKNLLKHNRKNESATTAPAAQPPDDKKHAKHEVALKKKLQKVLGKNNHDKPANQHTTTVGSSSGNNAKVSKISSENKTKAKPVSDSQAVHNKKTKKKQKKHRAMKESANYTITTPQNDENKRAKPLASTLAGEYSGKKRKLKVAQKPAKKFKTTAGFLVSDSNDQKQTKAVECELMKMKRKLEVSKTKKSRKQSGYTEAIGDAPLADTGERVIVHDIKNDEVPLTNGGGGSDGGASDSNEDEYIEKFFKTNAKVGASEGFNENKIYSVDSVEKQRVNGFLGKDSETDSDLSQSIEILSGSEEDEEEEEERGRHLPSNTNKQLLVYSADNSVAGSDSEESDSHSLSSGSYLSSEFDFLDSSHYQEEIDSDYDNYAERDLSGSESDFDDEIMSESSESVFETDTDYEYDSGSAEHNTSDSISDFDHYNEEAYDESQDSDYRLDSDEDDVYIEAGTAKCFKITDPRIRIFSNVNDSCIIELPKTDSEDESCIELVSMQTTKNEVMLLDQQRKEMKTAEQIRKKREDDCMRTIYERKREEFYNLDKIKPPEPATSRTVKPTVITCPSNSRIEYPLEGHLHDNWSDEETSFDITTITINSSVSSIPKVDIHKLDISKPSPQPEPMEIGNDEHIESSRSIVSDKRSPMKSSNGLNNSNVDQGDWGSMSRSEIYKLKPKFFNSINSRHVLLLLRSKVYFHGNLNVRLIIGGVEVFGYKLKLKETVTVHSPKGHSLVYFEPCKMAVEAEQIKISDKLEEFKSDFLSQDLEYLSKEFNVNKDALILLQRDTDNKGVNMIERYMKETMFPNINAFNVDSPYYSSEFILHCQFTFRPRKALLIDPAWSHIQLNNHSKLITIGGKGVGKSTFVRHTLNCNLNKFDRFLLIDLDIGQPELFVPQTVSATLVTEPILGPGYLKNFKPEKALLFGDVNVLPSPVKYLTCVQELLKFCHSKSDFANIPWIVNTMGYNRGFGLELLMCILKFLQPTHLVQIQSSIASENFNFIVTDTQVNAFKVDIFEEEMKTIKNNCKFVTHTFSATQNATGKRQNKSDLLAKDIRYAMILSKLGNILKSNSDWLTSIRPYEVSLSDLEIILTSAETVKEENYPELLNANLVYLCEKPKEGHNLTNNYSLFECRGIGIVRAVDVVTRKVYLLSSIPLNELQQVNALAIGAIPLHTSVLLNQHSAVRDLIPYVYNTDNFIGSKQVTHHVFRSEKNRRRR